jgi:hypothetical protein
MAPPLYVSYPSIPAVVCVILLLHLLPLQLRTHHIGQAPGPASASICSSFQQGQKRQVAKETKQKSKLVCVIQATFDSV